MSNPLLSLLGAALSVGFAPVKAQLANAETDPQAALSGLANLAATELGNLPAMENTAISEAAKIGLGLIADIEAKLGIGTAAAPAPQTAASAGTATS